MSLLSNLPFRESWWLLTALLAIPVYLWASRSHGYLTFSSLRLLPGDGSALSLRARLAFLPSALLALAVVSLAVALAGPRLGKSSGKIRKEGIAIMMVVDVSGSMRALDLSEGSRERTRLDAVKEVFADFVSPGGDLPGRPDDAIGVVSFAGFADTRCPLTLDHDNLLVIADSLELNESRSEGGTAIGEGLGLAVLRLRESDAKSKVAILLTDGVNNAGQETPLGAAELAKKFGIKVYTVGAGTNGVARIRVKSPFGGTSLQATSVEIDEATLREIADMTGGKYFRATDAEGLRSVYGEIDRLERSDLEEARFTEFTEYYPWFAGLGMLLAALGWLLGATWLRRLP